MSHDRLDWTTISLQWNCSQYKVDQLRSEVISITHTQINIIREQNYENNIKHTSVQKISNIFYRYALILIDYKNNCLEMIDLYNHIKFTHHMYFC